MNSQTVQILIAMIIYMAIVVVIGVVYAKKANKISIRFQKPSRGSLLSANWVNVPQLPHGWQKKNGIMMWLSVILMSRSL